jgi:hypothetical protein
MVRETVRLEPSIILDIQLRVGSNNEAVFAFFNAGGTPFDLTGTEWEMLFKSQPGNTNAFIITIGDGLEIGGDDDNELSVTILDDTQSIRPNVYYYQLNRTDLQKTWFNGNAEIVNGKYCA